MSRDSVILREPLNKDLKEVKGKAMRISRRTVSQVGALRGRCVWVFWTTTHPEARGL